MNSFYESLRETISNVEYMYGPTNCDPHWHQAVEILYAIDSDVYTLINSKEHILRAGEICIADCYDVHSFCSHGKNVIILIIPNELLNDYLKFKEKKHLATPYVTDSAACQKIVRLLREFENDHLSLLLQRGYVDAIMGLFCTHCGLEERADADVNLMQNVLNDLEKNYSEDISLNSLAGQYGYSKYYFSRMFNRFFKMNLNEYLARLRIRRFISAMQSDPNADIIGTAFDCGFNSWQTFYRCFKQFYNVSPKKFLKNIQ